MSNLLAALSDDDVRQITALIEALDRSTVDTLDIQLGDTRVTLSKGGAAPAPAAVAAGPIAAPIVQAPPSAAPPATAIIDDGTVAITAPIIGRFYASSAPGVPPFVAVGTRVKADDTVGLIEVMKVFNAVDAGVAGTITALVADDGAFVEYGQVLFRVRPDHRQ